MVAVVFGGGGGGGCIGFSMVLRMRHSGTLQPRFPAWVERVFDAVRESRRLAPPTSRTHQIAAHLLQEQANNMA